MSRSPRDTDADPYGLEYGDWEDPYDHGTLTMCTGCAMCLPWEGRLAEEIRSERRMAVLRWRENGERGGSHREGDMST